MRCCCGLLRTTRPLLPPLPQPRHPLLLSDSRFRSVEEHSYVHDEPRVVSSLLRSLCEVSVNQLTHPEGGSYTDGRFWLILNRFLGFFLIHGFKVKILLKFTSCSKNLSKLDLILILVQ